MPASTSQHFTTRAQLAWSAFRAPRQATSQWSATITDFERSADCGKPAPERSGTIDPLWVSGTSVSDGRLCSHRCKVGAQGRLAVQAGPWGRRCPARLLHRTRVRRLADDTTLTAMCPGRARQEVTSTLVLSEADAAMFPSFATGTRRRSSVSTCRKLAALRADSFRPRRRGGRRVWRRSAAAAMRLPRGDTLLTHHGNWSSKAAEAYHINERAADMESGASAVAELVVSHRAASCITAASLQQSSAPPVSTPRSCQMFWREHRTHRCKARVYHDIEPQP